MAAMSPRAKTAAAWLGWLLALIPVAAVAAQPRPTPRELASFAPRTGTVTLLAAGRTAGDHEWRIETAGLTDVETGADVNEPGIIYLPPAEPDSPTPTAENVFFFNDLIAADGWELAVEFAPEARGRWKLNGRFSPLGGELRPEVIIPVNALEHGENLLHVEGECGRVPRMYFRRTVDREREEITVARADWHARVVLLQRDEDRLKTVAEQSIDGPELKRRAVDWDAAGWTDRARLTDAALAVGRSLLHSQVRRRESLFFGGFNLVYDEQHRAHRMPHWLWSWGPSISLLLDLSELEAARTAGYAEAFRAAALAAGRCSLGFEMTDPQHPARGLSTVRWEPSRATPLGWAEYLSTADSLFLAGWGWMSLHRATGERVYLERTERLVAAAQRLMDDYPVIPQDWIIERQRWTPHTLDESVFGSIGFRRLFEATRSPAVAAAGRRFLDSHLEHMGREAGLLMRAWMRDEDKEIWDPDIKGHAWVIEGYLDAHRLSGEPKYLELARQLADRVMGCQAKDGSWTYLFKQPEPGDPIDDKGTAIWAYLFYDLYRSTRDPRHLSAARAALGWCLRQQYRGEDMNLDGAIRHPNSMAYVRRRPMTILYTTTFFGLALLQELALAETPQR